MSFARDLRAVVALSPRGWLDIAQAVFELGGARLRLTADHKRLLLAGTQDAATVPVSPAAAALIDRVAFAIPRAAARVPWRSDCLVQALAARRWLERRGIGSRLRIGVRKDQSASLAAHAWLRAGDRIVVGGDVADFTPLGQ